MCLHSPRKRFKLQKFYYKVLDGHSTGYFTPTFQSCGRRLRPNEWYLSINKKLPYSCGIFGRNRYRSGFHALLTLEDARKFVKETGFSTTPDVDGSYITICKVKLRRFTAWGIQGILGSKYKPDSVVAQKMMIVEEVK